MYCLNVLTPAAGTLLKRHSFIEAISEDMYVDDLVSGSNTIDEFQVIKQKSIELFRKGGFNLHKWHSNIPALPSSNTECRGIKTVTICLLLHLSLMKN